MTTNEFKEKVKLILDDALEGRIHPELESVMQESITDYENGFKNGGSDGEWKDKYESLKEKYIERFVNGSSDSDEEITDDNAGDDEEKKSELEIKTEDLFKEED